MSARLIETIAEIREAVVDTQRSGLTVGLVPTMGALHAGHLELIRRARAENDRVVATVFVNPSQFNQAADYERYPRTLEGDLETSTEAGVDWLFAPAAEEMYPGEPLAGVAVKGLDARLCGATRPGHFRGVTTVCTKLFHIVGADRAYFGEKDFQQLTIIRRMVADLDFPLEIVGVPTVREADGLALSSRNRLLNNEERAAGACLWRAMNAAKERLAVGEAKVRALVGAARVVLYAEPLARTEYVEIVDPLTLAPLEAVTAEARIALAVWIGETRLIDNMPLRPARQ